jgi:hypothetical protein
MAAPERPKLPPLTEAALNEVLGQCALIQVKDQPDRLGVIIRGHNSDNGRYQYQVICDLPTGPDTVICATKHQNQLIVATAKKLAALPDGLQVYGFSSELAMAVYSKRTLQPGDEVYSCHLERAEEMSDQERDSINKQIATMQQSQKELLSSRPGSPGASMSGNLDNMYELQRAHEEMSRRNAELNASLADFNARLQMAVSDIKTKEVASAAIEAELPLQKADSSSLVLADRNGTVHAISHNGKWVSLIELLDSTQNEPAKVKLTLNGGKNHISASLSLSWALAFAKPECSIVAATTLELESMEGGSVEERLAKIIPDPLSANSSTSTWQKNHSWNGQPTTLWIKVFLDSQRDKPIIDEVIKISYSDRFEAKWGKPPSPLIEIPKPEPHTPPDLAGEATSVDAQGTILDLIAAGDGSVLLVQTDKPPYWQAWDLTSRSLIKTSWQAGPDTLLAAQAGKIHLLDRNTGVVETWELHGKARLGLQVLQREGPMIAFAAAMSAAEAPLLVVTKKEGFFVDPVNFEILSNGFDMSSCFVKDHSHHTSLPLLIPETIRARASHDGVLFHVSGKQAQRTDTMSFPIILDPSGYATSDYTQGPHLALRGRMTSTHFPDHGGTGITLQTDSASNVFPGAGCTINFISNIPERKTVGVFRGAPMTLSGMSSNTGPLAHDRGIYFDSSHGVMVLPEENMLKIIPIQLPKQQAVLPRFTFVGQTLSIPLPKGKDHKLVSSIGGEIKMTDSAALWTAPEHTSRDNVTLTLEWNGELGSAMKTDFKITIRKQAQGPMAESPDGKTRIPLQRLSIISLPGQLSGFAGSGHVMITRGSGVYHVWSLSDYRKLFTTEKGADFCIGDADQIYTGDRYGKLKTYDLRTTKLIKETAIGKGNNGLSGITTGISSTIPLLAVERDESQPFLQIIDRKTLAPTLLDFPKEVQNRFFIAQFQTNPSGACSWSLNHLVTRQGNDISVRSFNAHMHGGKPDASGRFIVSSTGILDLQPKEPTMLRFDEILADNSYTYLNVDESGNYFMLSANDAKTDIPVVSVREIRAPRIEKFKMVLPANSTVHEMKFVSDVGKLILPHDGSNPRIEVYQLDIPSLLQDLAKP